MWEGEVDLQEVGEHNVVFECLGDPDQVQRVSVNGDLLGEQRGVVGAEKAAAIRIDADTEVAHAHFQHRLADDVGDRSCDAGVDLRGVVGRRVVLVVERYEEDARDEW